MALVMDISRLKIIKSISAIKKVHWYFYVHEFFFSFLGFFGLSWRFWASLVAIPYRAVKKQAH
jgi:hypothetical protein